MAARVFARRIRGGAAAQVAGVPAAEFDAASAPPPPDYANGDAWSALPGASTDKPADCFYIHTTAYFGDRWNASFDDAAAAAQVDQLHVHGDPDAHLPTSSTCFFSLHWPAYTTAAAAKEKLLYALYNCRDMDLN